MTKISNQEAYPSINIEDYDYVIGTNGDTEPLTTNNFEFYKIREYVNAGLSPEIGGTLKISEIVYNGVLTTPEEVVNQYLPNIIVLQYEVLIINVNGNKYLLKLQDVILGEERPATLSSDYISLVSAGITGVTGFSFTNANGILGTVINPTSTPNLTLSLGNINPTSTNGVSATTMSYLDATSSVQTQLNSKENTANKSTTTTLGTSNVLFPTQNAVKTYVDNKIDPLEVNNTDKTVWNNGKGDVATNASFGDSALKSNTTGNRNTANGSFSLYSNTTGNINTAVGAYSLFYNTVGNFNTANGWQALYSNTTGDNNVANGAGALSTNTAGDNNTAVGTDSLASNTTGSYNTANGYIALYANTTGTTNTANGAGALNANTTGGVNTANGYSALRFNTTGNNNTAVGTDSLASNITGSNNTALGYGADVISAALDNATAIGFGAIATASNTIRIGNSSVTQIGGQVGWSTLSDGRFKENIKEDVLGLSFITKLRPVTYNIISDTKIKTGFIAQEVEKTTKELDYDFSGVNIPQNDTDCYSLNYSEFVVPLVKAIQEQQQQINELKKLINYNN